MRHSNHKYKLSRDPAHRRALMKNLANELIEHGAITTTITKTKALRPFVGKLVTIAKNDSVANRRLVYSKLNSKKAVTELFNNLGPKFKTRPGGYTRILRLADNRLGDNAKVGRIAFVD